MISTHKLDTSFNKFNTKCNTCYTHFIFPFTNVNLKEKNEAFPLKYYTKPLSNARMKIVPVADIALPLPTAASIVF